MYQALYRKWRPRCFSDVVGQTAVTETLKTQVASGRLSHAYLFFGSHGTGKTTCAKILAKAVNCEHPVNGDPCNECASCRGIDDGSILDIIEIDAASNNGVDNVRELREEAVYSPAMVKKRVYIIDEVHMFSNQAFNALLKIMEEPPAHVLFILATTEQHKVLPTVLSRCQRFTFKRITADTIATRLEYVAESEGLSCAPGVLPLIARLANGGMRDALSILDQCASGAVDMITEATVADVIGLAGADAMYTLLRAIAEGDTDVALSTLASIYDEGRDLVSVLGELNTYLRDFLIQKTAPNANLNSLSARYDMELFTSCAELFSVSELVRGLDVIAQTQFRISGSLNRRIDAELCIIRLCSGDYAEKEEVPVVKKPAKKIVEQPTPKPSAPPVEAPAPVAAPIEEIPVPAEEPPSAPPPAKEDLDAAELWGRILKHAGLAPGLAVLFSKVTPVLKGGTLILECDNLMYRGMLKNPQNMECLRKEAEVQYGSPLTITVSEPVEHTVNEPLEALCKELEQIPNLDFRVE
ncbi:MAG: DNA polymerase III subunit gamma/tau [Oscillospiraceae bacterium]|nr:DNA polymerase III subunit gamma/tau [Oscillospiraceae bacterium]